jgi:hypothetical protein
LVSACASGAASNFLAKLGVTWIVEVLISLVLGDGSMGTWWVTCRTAPDIESSSLLIAIPVCAHGSSSAFLPESFV